MQPDREGGSSGRKSGYLSKFSENKVCHSSELGHPRALWGSTQPEGNYTAASALGLKGNMGGSLRKALRA